MYTRKQYLIAGVVVVGIAIVIMYVKWGTSISDKSKASKTRIQNSATSRKNNTSSATGTGDAPGDLNDEDDYEDLCGVNKIELESIQNIVDSGEIKEAPRLKHTSEINLNPTLIRKNSQAKYMKFTFKPKLESVTFIGFWKPTTSPVEMTFKLCIKKIGNQNYRVQVNKRIVQSFSNMKIVEFELKDSNSLLITINESTTIPLYMVNLQYVGVFADSSIKLYEAEKKP